MYLIWRTAISQHVPESLAMGISRDIVINWILVFNFTCSRKKKWWVETEIKRNLRRLPWCVFRKAQRTCCLSVKFSTISINLFIWHWVYWHGVFFFFFLHRNNNYFWTDDNHFSLLSIFSNHVVPIEFQFEWTPARVFVQSILFTSLVLLLLLLFLDWQIKNAKFMAQESGRMTSHTPIHSNGFFIERQSIRCDSVFVWMTINWNWIQWIV